MSQGARNSLGSTLTVFRVDDWGAELEGLLKGYVPTKSDEEEEEIIKEKVCTKGTNHDSGQGR